MASHIERGESLLIPFRDGLSISDSQNKPRMYKTRQMFEKAFPKHYLGTDGVELVEYAEVRHGRWVDKPTGAYRAQQSWCSACGKRSGIGGIESNRHKPFCPNCGARMDAE